MKNTMIKVGTVVPNMKVADVTFNTSIIIETILKHKDCSLLVFPELCMTGYTCADLFQSHALLQAVEQAVVEIAKNVNKEMTVVIGAPLRKDNCIYNCAVFISSFQIVAVVPKIHIPTYSEFYEGRWFTSGKDIKNTTIQIQNQIIPFGVDILIEDSYSKAIIGTDICEDLWVGDKPSTHACLAGANIIVNLSASDELIGKQEYRRNLVEMQSATCYCAYCYASSGVHESSTDLVFSGHSLIYENGKELCNSIYHKETYVDTALIDLDTIHYNRTHQNTFMTSHTEYRKIHASIPPIQKSYTIEVDELVTCLKNENYRIARYPFVPDGDIERSRRCDTILQIQAHALATRVRSTHISNLIIGISGGLDSTLALLVCHEAKKIEPSIHVIAYTMPNKGNTTSLTYNNAMRLMQALDVEIREVSIEKGVQLHLEEIGHGNTYQGENDTTYENAQARYRTYILMDAANMENGLVVGTGDLSELALGWCTYNGDHMSMYSVNASVPKTLVKYLCTNYAYTCKQKELQEVLLAIVDTPISPELTPSKNGQIVQKTEEKIGKYDLNDFFLFYTLRYGFTPSKLLAFALYAYTEVKKQDMKDALIRFYNRFFHQQFKRSCLPDGPKIGSVSLSPRGDWRMPSDASVQLWIDEVKNA